MIWNFRSVIKSIDNLWLISLLFINSCQSKWKETKIGLKTFITSWTQTKEGNSNQRKKSLNKWSRTMTESTWVKSWLWSPLKSKKSFNLWLKLSCFSIQIIISWLDVMSSLKVLKASELSYLRRISIWYSRIWIKTVMGS